MTRPRQASTNPLLASGVLPPLRHAVAANFTSGPTLATALRKPDS
jgi:hypothetical protein